MVPWCRAQNRDPSLTSTGSGWFVTGQYFLALLEDVLDLCEWLLGDGGAMAALSSSSSIIILAALEEKTQILPALEPVASLHTTQAICFLCCLVIV